jgi:glycosyltransferase involved in cell wall biosynthesis
VAGNTPILTIAVPTFNMDRWLDKNLRTYCSDALKYRLEVIVLNNASEDNSKEIAESYCKEYPETFVLIDRESRGYGSSINAAISVARGKYFRIVDADDWVDTDELEHLLSALDSYDVDVVVNDYRIVNMQTGAEKSVKASDQGIEYNKVFRDLRACTLFLPSIHSTVYNIAILRESGFQMQDKMYFVDEEYVILPFLNVKNNIFSDCDVYRYQVANPEQSMSPQNRAKYRKHRESVLKRLLAAYKDAEKSEEKSEALSYCFIRIGKGVGDHFTTLYMYMTDRREGRREANAWREYLKSEYPAFWITSKNKVHILSLLNLLRINLRMYKWLKRHFVKRESMV